MSTLEVPASSPAVSHILNGVHPAKIRRPSVPDSMIVRGRSASTNSWSGTAADVHHLFLFFLVRVKSLGVGSVPFHGGWCEMERNGPSVTVHA